MSTVSGTNSKTVPAVDRTQDLDAITGKAIARPEETLAPAESAPDLAGTGGTAGEAELRTSLGQARLRQAPSVSAETAAIVADLDRRSAGVADTGSVGMSNAADLPGFTDLVKKGKDWVDVAKGFGEKAKLGEKFIGTASKHIAAFDELVSRHRDAVLAVNTKMQGINSAIASGLLGPEQLRMAAMDLARLEATGKTLSGQLETLEGASQSLFRSLKPHQKAIAGFEKFGKSMERIQDTQRLTGKMLVGLDMGLKFAEFQKKDPDNWKTNAFKAVTSTLAKKGFEEALKKANPKLSVSEQAVGLLKTGLDLMGLGKTPIGMSVDAISQGFPTDVAVRGVEQAIDQLSATAEWARTGDPKAWLDIDKHNMAGDNGQVFQGAVMLADMVATGGKNIPTGDGVFGIEFAKSLGFWKDDIPMSEVGRTAQDKIGLINKMAEGSGTPEAHADHMRAVISSSTPRMAAEVLGKVDIPKLVDSMRMEKLSKRDPVAALVQTVSKQYAATTDPSVRRLLERELGEILREVSAQGKTRTQRQLTEMMAKGMLPDLTPALRGQIRSYTAQ
ncbi:MAG: hypothetical protein R2762_01930 [Bryobacteraceae bacterium]